MSINIPSGARAADDPASLDEPPASLSLHRAASIALVSFFSFWQEERTEVRGEREWREQANGRGGYDKSKGGHGSVCLRSRSVFTIGLNSMQVNISCKRYQPARTRHCSSTE